MVTGEKVKNPNSAVLIGHRRLLGVNDSCARYVTKLLGRLDEVLDSAVNIIILSELFFRIAHSFFLFLSTQDEILPETAQSFK